MLLCDKAMSSEVCMRVSGTGTKLLTWHFGNHAAAWSLPWFWFPIIIHRRGTYVITSKARMQNGTAKSLVAVAHLHSLAGGPLTESKHCQSCSPHALQFARPQPALGMGRVEESDH